MCFSLCLVFLKENNAKIVFFFPCNYHHWFLVLSRIDSCVFWLAQTCYFVLCLFPLFWCVAVEWTSYNWAIQGFGRCSYAIKNLTYRILTLNVLGYLCIQIYSTKFNTSSLVIYYRMSKMGQSYVIVLSLNLYTRKAIQVLMC